MTKPVLPHVGSTDASTLEYLLLMAKTMVTSLIRGGTTFGEDFSIRDPYTWATPFALHVFKNGNVTFVFSNTRR